MLFAVIHRRSFHIPCTPGKSRAHAARTENLHTSFSAMLLPLQVIAERDEWAGCRDNFLPLLLSDCQIVRRDRRCRITRCPRSPEAYFFSLHFFPITTTATVAGSSQFLSPDHCFFFFLSSFRYYPCGQMLMSGCLWCCCRSPSTTEHGSF